MEKLDKIIGTPAEAIDRIQEAIKKEEAEKSSEVVMGKNSPEDLQEAKEVSLQLRDFLKKRKGTKEELSQTDVANSIAVGISTLSQWLSNTYPGTVSEITGKVKSYLSLQSEREKNPRFHLNFTVTSVVKTIWEIADRCHQDCKLGAVYGNPGFGKTEGIKGYMKKHSDSIFIETNPGWKRRTVMRMLHMKLGMNGEGYVDDIELDCINRLMDTGRLVIIDEAENLDSKILNSLRRIHDHAHVGMLMVGTSALVHNLRGKHRAFGQLHSRAFRSVELKPVSLKDIELIISNVQSPLLARKNLSRIFHEESMGNTRFLEHLVTESLRVAHMNNMDVTPEIIKGVKNMLII